MSKKRCAKLRGVKLNPNNVRFVQEQKRIWHLEGAFNQNQESQTIKNQYKCQKMAKLKFFSKSEQQTPEWSSVGQAQAMTR